MEKKVDLSVELNGIRFRNPLILSEGPLSGNARLIRRAAEHRVGGITTKSILPNEQFSSNPYMIAANGGLINADWTDIGFDNWVKELQTLELDVPLIVNVTTHQCPPAKAAELAEQLQDLGASIITFSDYIPENLVEVVRQSSKKVHIPTMVKLPPFVSEIGELCKRLEDAGVSMIAAMDAVGPAMDIDLKTRRPILGCDGAFGYMSAKPIFPLTLAYIASICESVSVPVVGVGGVTTAADALKLIMAGASLVGIVGGAILKGLSIFDKIEKDLEKWMIENNVKSLDEIRGVAQDYLHPELAFDLRSVIDQEGCIGCAICSHACYAGAITMNDSKKAEVDQTYCTGCGVCVSVCPVDVITLE